jgi:hypothetical protein
MYTRLRCHQAFDASCFAGKEHVLEDVGRHYCQVGVIQHTAKRGVDVVRVL